MIRALESQELPSRVNGSPTSHRVHPPSPLSRSRSGSAASNATTSSSSPSVPSPLSREAQFPIPRSHPHARKQSIFDGQFIQDLTSSVSSSDPSASTAAPSTSFSLALDPINETASVPPTPMPPSPITRSNPEFYGVRPSAKAINRPSQLNDSNTKSSGTASSQPPRRSSLSQVTSASIGLGQPPKSSSSLASTHVRSQSHSNITPSSSNTTIESSAPPTTNKRTAFSSTFSAPNTEVLLWSYAQLLGILEIDDSTSNAPGELVSPSIIDELRQKLITVRGGSVVGGGRMDIGGMPSPSAIGAGSRTRRGFISSLLGTSGTGPTPSSYHNSSGSLSGLGLGVLGSTLFGSTQNSELSSRGLSLDIDNLHERTSGTATIAVAGGLPPEALPTFETQPSMLAVDLNLAPGESRSYTYSVPLPAVLPPTFRGKVVKFSYHLVIGTSRATAFPVPPTPNPQDSSSGPRSKIMRVPIRIYSNVSVGRRQIPYDLLWPIARRRMGPIKCMVKEEMGQQLANAKRPNPSPKGSKEQFDDYAQKVLALSSSPPNPPGDDDVRTITDHVNGNVDMPSQSRYDPMEDNLFSNNVHSEEQGSGNCRENVEILTRVSKKMSYDISKDGLNVATLTFVKSAYRLGETVMGVVEMNEPGSRAKVLKVSAILESHETLPRTFGGSERSSQNTRGLRRVHAEHHTSLVINSRRIAFGLDIPSDASPGFRFMHQDESGDYEDEGGIEWKVRLCFLVAMVPPSNEPDAPNPSKVEMRHLTKDGVGGDWGTSWRASSTLAPLVKASLLPPSFIPPSSGVFQKTHNRAAGSSWSLRSWLGGGEEVAMDKDRWQELGSETVECEVGIVVWPGNTLYRPVQCEFEV
ncbi:hypothetical protein FRC03_012068 [Tulasnella sp. 419]|nr:hypothetical protein FRC03_012068 [Tulasnella sp. 419]